MGEAKVPFQNNSYRVIVPALLTVMSLVGCGKPSYDLRGASKVGDVLRDELHLSMPAGRVVAKVQDRAVEGKASLEACVVREVSILAVDQKGEATKIKVSHLRDQWTTRFETPNEQPEETKEDGVLQGESVILELVAGRWKKTLFGKRPTPEQAKELQDYANPLEDDLIPKGRVKVGGSWAARDSALRKFIGSGFHNLTGSMSAQFEDVVERDGQQYALIASDMNVTGMALDAESHEVNISMSAHITTHRCLKSLCDCSSGDGMMKMETEAVVSGSSVRTTINGPLSLKQEQTRL
jgi:hypothetical protein